MRRIPGWRLFSVVMASLSLAAVAILFMRWFVRSFLLAFEPYRELRARVSESIGTDALMLIAGATLFAVFFAGIVYFGRRLASVPFRFADKRQGLPPLRTLRWKLVFAFFCSVAVTIVLLWAIRATGSLLLKRNEALAGWIRPQVDRIGELPILAGIGSVIFLVLFFLLSDQIIRYLKEITRGLQLIGEGRLERRIAERSADELGEEAHNINRMSRKLAETMEEERLAEKTKNDLITGVSHDLRPPLTSILGFLELIANGRYKDEEELRSYAGIAYDKSLSLKRLIDDLFDYTRLSNGMPLELAELELNGFCKQPMEEFVPALKAADMEGTVIASDRLLRIAADGNRLVRAYENLISNAIRYGRDGGKVVVRLREEGGEAVAEVVNFGEPIPERDLPFLFDRFYRVDPSRSKDTGGTGLGLAIARTIVERHGGTISVRSSEEETAFVTRFPLKGNAH